MYYCPSYCEAAEKRSQASLVEGLNVEKLAFQSSMDAVNTYLNGHGVPPEVKRRVRQFCFYKRDAQEVGDADAVMGAVSPALKSELLLLEYGAIIWACPFFEGAPQAFISDVASLLETMVFGPKDLVSARV